MNANFDLVRNDTLPEYSNYVDNGCDLFDSCLNCPLIRCRYDDPGWIHKDIIEKRDMKIYEKRKKGCSIKILAEEYSVSTRTIHRAMKRIKNINGVYKYERNSNVKVQISN